MFAVIIDRRRDASSPWHPALVAGVFSTLPRALALGRHVPDGEHASVRIVELAPASFPFFLVEDLDFTGVDRAGLDGLMAEAARERRRFAVDKAKDDVHFIVYRLDREYAPAPPGIDALGTLPHFHVVDQTLDSVRDGLRPWFWQQWLDRADRAPPAR